ncbi:MAG: Rne/Rng family ribonuclease [Candidatus Nitronauta litoralis]|uniref:Ribonuclease G n=1 Tax=Candidatus Nitronauta litoralis TaxID=2705533 RepID=A0A7T0G1U7_9BACT|nr:MAG: Rne/Rng family ribonuclease [Candidatus Nitronauta litoralis]
MSSKKKLLINADHPEECRAVVLDDGKLDEIIIEHSARELIKGNIYLGVITRVEPAIEAAFVDIGGKKFGFLPFKDVLKESYLQTREKKAKVRIQDVLVRGQKILVQAVKESRDAKGPSLNNGITIPGRFLVLMYGSLSTGVSRKIEDEAERRKLKEILADLELPENMGVIIRTAGVGRTKTELQKDLQMLLKIWESIQEKLKESSAKAPLLLYEGPNMVVRTVRDHFTADTSEILVDSKESYKALKEFMKMVMPRMGSRIKLYQETQPLFSAYGVEDQIENIYERKVNLPSGGSIVFDMGEAMVCVDVNSGKTTSASELEETASKTNLEAADEIARQLRLRDLGGLVVIDFIDMFQKKNKSLVEKQMKQACKNDKARINISRISRFGLLEMSRQRMSPPLKEGVYDTCSTCGGSGTVRTPSNLALQLIRKMQEALSADNVKVLSVTLSNSVATYLLNNKMDYLVSIQERQGFRLQFNTQENLDQKDFSFEVLERKKEEKIEEKGEEAPKEKPSKVSRGRRVSTKDDKSEDKKPQEEKSRGSSRSRRSSTREEKQEENSQQGEKPRRNLRSRRPSGRREKPEEKPSQVNETPPAETGAKATSDPESVEEKPQRGRRRVAGTSQTRRAPRKASSSTKRAGSPRGRRWRSQRADREGENKTASVGENTGHSSEPGENTPTPDIVSPSLPLAGDIEGNLKSQPDVDTGSYGTSNTEPPPANLPQERQSSPGPRNEDPPQINEEYPSGF